MIQLRSISGKQETRDYSKVENINKYENVTLDLCIFYGGDLRGKCLQLSIKDQHIQLDEDRTKELLKEIIKTL